MKKQILVIFLLFCCLLWVNINPLQLYSKHSEVIHVNVEGAVKKETQLEIPLYSTIEVALNQVEVLDTADLSVLNLQTILKDGDVITIPYAKSEDDVQRISINTATVSELCNLNGIGESIAQRIIEYRENNGGFQAIEDLMNVKGIGEKKFEKIKDDITL